MTGNELARRMDVLKEHGVAHSHVATEAKVSRMTLYRYRDHGEADLGALASPAMEAALSRLERRNGIRKGGTALSGSR